MFTQLIGICAIGLHYIHMAGIFEVRRNGIEIEYSLMHGVEKIVRVQAIRCGINGRYSETCYCLVTEL